MNPAIKYDMTNKNAFITGAATGIGRATTLAFAHQDALVILIHGDKKIQIQFAATEPVGRMVHPEEIATAVLWLASDQSSFVTGHPLTVDSGWVAQ